MRRSEAAVALALALVVVGGPAADALPGTDTVSTVIRDTWSDVHEGLWDPSLYVADDVITTSGIDFVHAGFHDEHLTFLESTSGGACWGDHDNDGHLDLYVTDTIDAAGRGLSRLYRNLGPGADGAPSFTDVTLAQGVGLRAVAQGCAWGDYDNDGWQDLYVTALPTQYSPQRNVLFRNLGEGNGFEDVTARAGVDGTSPDHPGGGCAATAPLSLGGTTTRCWSVSAAWLDFDLDGDLDLYVANYVEFGIGACIVLHPSNPLFCQGQPNRLYRNDGDGTFTDVAREAGAAVNGQSSLGRSLGVIASDIDGDAWPDLYVTNDQDANALYLNNRDGTFRSVGTSLGVDNGGMSPKGYRHRAGMGVDAQDFDNDGLVDLLSTHYKGEDDAIYRNTGGGWEEVTRAMGVNRAVRWDESRWGGGFVDMNMDGWRDYVVVGGGVIKGERGPIHLYLHNGTGFERQHEPMWPYVKNHRANHRAAAFADYDNDGDWDMYVSTLSDVDHNPGQPKLLRFGAAKTSPVTPHHWLRLDLVGTDSARDAYGAKVAVTTESGLTQHAWKASGGSYAGTNDPRLLLSLQNATRGTVTVTWPGGATQGPIPFDLGTDRGLDLTLTEPNARAPAAPRALAAKVADDDVVLTWSSTLATDFASYRVWRAAVPDFDAAEVVAETTGRTDVHAVAAHPAEGQAWFWATIVDAGGLESEPSPAAVVGEPAKSLFAKVPAPAALPFLIGVAAAAWCARRR